MRARCPSGSSDSKSLARNSICARLGINTRATPAAIGLTAGGWVSARSTSSAKREIWGLFVMGIGRNFNFDHAILPDPLPSFAAVRRFFHRF